jgi:exosortase A
VNTGHAQSGAVSAAPADASARRQRLRALVAIGVVLATFAAFWPSTLSLMARWEDTVGRTYTHGYVVFALGLWLIWRNRGHWAVGAARPWLPALFPFLCGALGWLVAYRAGLQIVHQAALPALAACALLVVFGWRMLRALAFPLAWFYLVIPVWDTVLPLLNWISVMVVRVLLRVADIPAFFVGNAIELPFGTFAVADGCSGVHFFIVGLAVALLYGEINRDTVRTRVKLVVLALLLAMITNWVRIFIIVLAGYFTDMQHTLVANEHYSFGWYMFAGMMVLYFLVVRRWPAADQPAPADDAPAAAGMPRHALLAVVLALALMPLVLAADRNQASDPAVTQAMLVAGVAPAQLAWRPDFPGADREFFGTHAGAPDVQFYSAGFASQRQGKEIAGFRTSALGASLHRTRVAAGPVPAPWREEAAIDDAGVGWLVWHAYRLDDRWYTSRLRLQLEYGFRSLTGAPAAAVIALRARCERPDCADARASLTRFAEKSTP